eukprot:g3292.t1
MAALAAGTGAESKTTAQTGRNRYPPPCIDDAAHLDLVYAPSEEEREALAKFDEAHGEEFVDVLPGKRLRFLRARDLELDKAVKMLRNHMKWFKEHRPEQLVEEDINEKAINSQCWRYLGQTADGSGIKEVQVGKWNPHEYTKDEYIKYVAFFSVMAERMLKRHTKNVVIFDISGWALWHGSYLGYVNRLVDIAQNQYPERLRRVLLVNAPFLFRGAWSVISPWLDPVTKAKIKFVSSASALREEFAELSISLDLIPARYGGNIEDESTIPCPGFAEFMANMEDLTEPDCNDEVGL